MELSSFKEVEIKHVKCMVQSSKHFGFQMALRYMEPLKFLIFLFLEKYQKDVENFVERVGSVIFIVILSVFLISCRCFHIICDVDAPLFRIAWLVPCWQFLKFILCILTNNCVSFAVSSKALFLQTTFQLSRLISVIILKTLWCANAILLCE